MKTSIAIAALFAATLSGTALAEPFNDRGPRPYVEGRSSTTERQVVQAHPGGFNERTGPAYVESAPTAAVKAPRLSADLGGHNDKSEA